MNDTQTITIPIQPGQPVDIRLRFELQQSDAGQEIDTFRRPMKTEDAAAFCGISPSTFRRRAAVLDIEPTLNRTWLPEDVQRIAQTKKEAL